MRLKEETRTYVGSDTPDGQGEEDDTQGKKPVEAMHSRHDGWWRDVAERQYRSSGQYDVLALRELKVRRIPSRGLVTIGPDERYFCLAPGHLLIVHRCCVAERHPRRR